MRVGFGIMKYILDKNYNSLGRQERWDQETQKTIKQRIANELGDVLTYEFLSAKDGEILEFLVDTLIPQEKNEDYVHPIKSREAGAPTAQFNRVKISEAIDRELARDIKKVRYGNDPWPREFYRRGLAEIEKFIKDEYGKPIEDFSGSQLENMVEKIFSLGTDNFLHQFLRKVLSDAAGIYYSHPKSWNEIGFPGPAYPEGYAYLDCDKAWEWEPKYEKE